MTKFHIMIIRFLLGAGIAVLLLRMFYPEASPLYAVLLAAFLVGGAYLREYLYERAEKKNKGAGDS